VLIATTLMIWLTVCALTMLAPLANAACRPLFLRCPERLARVILEGRQWGSSRGAINMFMNLLPGLRELRAPLAAGYLWLASLWLVLSGVGWLPAKRPSGDGEVAQLWDLSGILGKTVMLAVVTFIAYLIGSFLEMFPDGPFADRLVPLVLLRRRPWYLPSGMVFVRGTEDRMVDAEPDLGKWARIRELTGRVPESSSSNKVTQETRKRMVGRRVARSLSSDARRDLARLLAQRPEIGVYPPDDNVQRGSPEERELLKQQAEYDLRVDQIIDKIILEMQQLASRLLVKSKDLFSKYDRHMAEAAVRINVSKPLTLLLILASVLSGIPIWLRIMLPFVALALGFILLRQGFLRAVSARDVIAQALAIGEIGSRHVPPQKHTEERPKEPAKDKGSQTPPDEERTEVPSNEEDAGRVASVGSR
jgi:hypothetical protein